MVFFTLAMPKSHARELHLVTPSSPPIIASPDNPGYMTLIAREAFQRIGVHITIDTLPAERCLINSNSGLDDGDLVRVAGLEKTYPNLIRVPEKVMDFEFVAFTLNKGIRIKNLAELAPYSVAYVTGWKFYEQRIKQAREITKVRNLAELFELLQKGRSEIVLAERWQGLWAANQSRVKARPLQPPFKIAHMYIYLNKRHAALVPKVAQALLDMKKDGSFQRIVDQTLHPLDVQ